MTTRIIKVKSCGECPYHEDDRESGYEPICNQRKDKCFVPIVLGKEYFKPGEFPSWCPLEKEKP